MTADAEEKDFVCGGDDTVRAGNIFLCERNGDEPK